MRSVALMFDKDVGVRDLSLAIKTGTIFGLIGPSGSGKTTTLRMMLGIYKDYDGDLRVLGESPQNFSRKTRERIGYMPQQFVLYPNLTVNENLRFVAALYGLNPFRRGARIREVLEMVDMAETGSRLARNLSGGQQRRLNLAAAILHKPDLVMLDEPTAGIDPVLRARLWEQFRRFRDEGRTMIITTQYVGEAAYCDLVGVMAEGRLGYLDTPDRLRRKAFGGEVISLTVSSSQTLAAMQFLEEQQFVKKTRRLPEAPGQIHVTVDDAAKYIPIILRMCSTVGIKVRRVNEYVPSFDIVFQRLIARKTTKTVNGSGANHA